MSDASLDDLTFHQRKTWLWNHQMSVPAVVYAEIRSLAFDGDLPANAAGNELSAEIDTFRTEERTQNFRASSTKKKFPSKEHA